jgi:hypothetical protein
MKQKSNHQIRHPPTLTAHISFGEVGLGPDGERFIRVNIDIAKKQHIVLLRYDDFVNGSGHALARLNTLGAHLISSPAKSEFLRRLQDLGPLEPSFNVATRVGPFGNAFVLPDTVLSASKKHFATWFDDGLTDYLSWGRKGGTLKQWKMLAALAQGNSRLILALGVAFVGPLRLITPVESLAFQLTGPGGTGKSTVGVVASSIWGQRRLGGRPHPLGGGDAWNNTLANLERVLASRNHTFLFLDEAHLARPQDIVAAIFSICEGQGRGRYNETRRWQWFAPMFSTSNNSVAEILAKAREPADRAAFDRLIDVPLPEGKFGAFENLHGSDTIGDFVLRLKAICDENYGVVGRRWVLKILRELAEDSGELASWLKARRSYFIRQGRKNVSADSRHERVISHFATVYVALRLANRYDLLTLPQGGTRDALLACLADHLTVTDGAADRLVARSPLGLLKTYVQKNRDNFAILDGTPLPKGHNHATCPGYAYQAAGRQWFGFPNAVVESVVGGRGPLSALCHQLDTSGLIKKAGGGQAGDRFATKVMVGSKRVYLLSFDSSVFD